MRFGFQSWGADGALEIGDDQLVSQLYAQHFCHWSFRGGIHVPGFSIAKGGIIKVPAAYKRWGASRVGDEHAEAPRYGESHGNSAVLTWDEASEVLDVDPGAWASSLRSHDFHLLFVLY